MLTTRYREIIKYGVRKIKERDGVDERKDMGE
jgi:hypothetical protein